MSLLDAKQAVDVEALRALSAELAAMADRLGELYDDHVLVGVQEMSQLYDAKGSVEGVARIIGERLGRVERGLVATLAAVRAE